MLNFGTDRTVVPIELVTYAMGQIEMKPKNSTIAYACRAKSVHHKAPIWLLGHYYFFGGINQYDTPSV
jgi:hypothetical protein